MRKKKIDSKGSHDLYSDSIIKISQEQSEYFFEVGKELTTDIAEAVSILIRQKEMWNSPVWEVEITDISHQDICPEKSLFWLTGGHLEWKTLEHYNRPWCDAYLDFQEEFGVTIINIVKKSKKLKDIRDNFLKYLSLPTLYDFAVRKNMIR